MSFATLVQAAAEKLDLGPLETKTMSDKLKAYVKSLSELDGSKGKNLDVRIANLKAGIAKWAKKVRAAKTPVEKRKANFVFNGQRRALGWHMEAKKLQGKGE